MATCGAKTRSGSPCALVAGWGTGHKGSGRCKHHEGHERELPPTLSGGVNRAPQYTIDDSVTYTTPVVLPYTVIRDGAESVSRYLSEYTQRQTYRFQFDSPNRSGTYDGPVWMPTDDPLCEWDIETRREVISQCHAAFHRNPLAKQAVQLTRQFAVGKGHTVVCQNQQVQEIIDTFRANKENAIYDYDRTFVQDLQIDGELFLRMVAGGADGSVIVPIRPWDICEIATERGFLRRVQKYHMQYSHVLVTDGYPDVDVVDEWIDADEVLHVAINRHSYELRGRSDLFVVLPWLRAFKEWLENRARQNKWRNTLAFDVSVDGTPTQVSQAASKYSTPPTDGSIVVHHKNEEWNVMSNPVGAGEASEDGRQIKLMSAVGFGLPEYMLSDGENANLASATAQELPALWRFIDIQQLMGEQVWTPIYKWVLQQAVDAGELPETVPVQDSDGDAVEDGKQVKAVEAFEVQYPELQEDDPKTLAEALQIAVMNDWLSNESASTQMGFDFAQERKRIEREKKQEQDEIKQGLRQPLPGIAGNNGQTGQERGDNAQNANGQRVATSG